MRSTTSSGGRGWPHSSTGGTGQPSVVLAAGVGQLAGGTAAATVWLMVAVDALQQELHRGGGATGAFSLAIKP